MNRKTAKNCPLIDRHYWVLYPYYYCILQKTDGIIHKRHCANTQMHKHIIKMDQELNDAEPGALSTDLLASRNIP
jgi:hypothetical protein